MRKEKSYLFNFVYFIFFIFNWFFHLFFFFSDFVQRYFIIIKIFHHLLNFFRYFILFLQLDFVYFLFNLELSIIFFFSNFGYESIDAFIILRIQNMFSQLNNGIDNWNFDHNQIDNYKVKSQSNGRIHSHTLEKVYILIEVYRCCIYVYVSLDAWVICDYEQNIDLVRSSRKWYINRSILTSYASNYKIISKYLINIYHSIQIVLRDSKIQLKFLIYSIKLLKKLILCVIHLLYKPIVLINSLQIII